MHNDTLREIGGILGAVRAKKPLVHQITNYVTVNDCANVTLAIGASPIMADDITEAADIASVASALVINIGTLNSRTVESMLAAGRAANAAGVPVVLDPVGAGASRLRNDTVWKLLEEVRFAVVRGNLSEIRFIAGLDANTKGVDAGDVEADGDSVAMAKALAARLDTVVAITGKTDIVTDGGRVLQLDNGHPMLSSVTGTGCMTTALVGSLCGATDDYMLAAAGGILCMGIAGERAYAAAGARGTGSFRVALIDALSQLDAPSLEKEARLR